MSGRVNVVKGRIKEAAGALIGNEKLRKKGRTEQAAGRVEGTVEKAAAEVKHGVDAVGKAVKKALD